MNRVLVVLVSLAVLGATGAATLFGYNAVRTGVASDIYRERLEKVAGDYESLRGRYNDAVKRTAVTELVVEGDSLKVRVRDARGVLQEIDTPYDPSGEIYVDYAVIDGRLWMRRVFDSQTRPRDALVIDPSIADIDWDDSGARFGQAVYRSLSEGRWVVSVSGDGSLGLAQVREEAEVELVTPPALGEFGEVRDELDARLDRIGPGEIWRRLLGG